MNPDPTLLAYLVPRHEAFWRWGQGGKVLEWHDGATIAFAAEIHAVLTRLAPMGLPRFGALVLLLAACRDNWSAKADGSHILARCQEDLVAGLETMSIGGQFIASTVVPARLQQDVREAILELERVAGLPHEQRTQLSFKCTLAEVVFESATPSVDPMKADALVRSMQGVDLSGLLNVAPSDRGLRGLAADLDELRRGLPHLDTGRLALRQRTGMDQVVEPADEDLPEPLRIRQLLGRLRQDEELAGLAQLAQGALAALHVPRRLSSRQELPVGGVSDISNRGPLDRLLLSELAHDDTTLAARVALNEALYLRRESPADDPPPGRAVLIDCGIRMWGVPRIFGTAVAMALLASADRKSPLVRAWRARGPQIEPADLSRRSGLLEHLEVLESAPHPAAALPAWLSELDDNHRDVGPEAELFLVTHEDVLADMEFSRALHATDPRRTWHIATVDRDGCLRLHLHHPGGRRLLCQAKLSLEQVLADPPGIAKPISLIREGADRSLPVILNTEPFPLRLPCQIDPQRSAASALGLFSATIDGRLMHWTGPGRGGIQLTDVLPPGRFRRIFVDDDRKLVILVTSQKKQNQLCFLVVDLATGQVHRELANQSLPRHIFMDSGRVFCVSGKQVTAYDPRQPGHRATVELPDMAWTHGRFCFDGAVHFAAYFDGQRITVEKVTSQPCVAVFDRRFGPSPGPWLLFRDGSMAPASGDAGLTTPATTYQGLELVGVSADGQRVAVRAPSHSDAAHVFAFDDMAWKSVNTNVHELLLGPQSTWAWPDSMQLHSEFEEISVGPAGELRLRNRDLLWQVVSVDRTGELVLAKCDLARPNAEATRARMLYRRSPIDGTGYQLRQARWAGGNAFLDSRGMLHLQSSDKTIPELTLILSNRPISGWTSAAQLFGNVFFLGGIPTASGADIDRIIRQFTARLR